MSVAIATLRERLAEAEAARHKLAIDGLASYTTTNGETYTKHRLGELTRYCDELRRELRAMTRGRFAYMRRGGGA